MTDWNLTETYVFRGHFIRFNVAGRGPAVIVVHGTPWSSYNLRHVIRALSRDFTVYYFDLLGYGQSEQSAGDVSLGVQNMLLDALIDHWGLDAPSIVGHDFGGATALRTHLLNKQRFSKIVLIDPVALSPWGSPFFAHVKRHEAAFAGVPDNIHEAIVRAYIGGAAFTEIADETMRNTVEPWTGAEGKVAFYRQIAQADERYTDEVEDAYATIVTPTMILWGAEDRWIPAARGHQLQQMIPGSELHCIPGAGHLIIEEAPQQLIDRLHPFLCGP